MQALPVERDMTMQRVVITGGSGLLALNWACAVRDKWDVVLATHTQSVQLSGAVTCKLILDQSDQLIRDLNELAPDLVVHAAGLTNVDQCEQDPQSAHHVNAVIARNVAQATAAAMFRLSISLRITYSRVNGAFIKRTLFPNRLMSMAEPKHWRKSGCRRKIGKR
jgi:nucleoside-diphosphate-sugar epimerase